MSETVSLRPSKEMTKKPFIMMGVLTLAIIMTLAIYYKQSGVSLSSCLSFSGGCFLPFIVTVFFGFIIIHIQMRNIITASTHISEQGISFMGLTGVKSLEWMNVKSIRILKGIWSGLVIELSDNQKKIRFSYGLFDDVLLEKLLKEKLPETLGEQKTNLFSEISAFKSSKEIES
jgi:hypothetical protein